MGNKKKKKNYHPGVAVPAPIPVDNTRLSFGRVILPLLLFISFLGYALVLLVKEVRGYDPDPRMPLFLALSFFFYAFAASAPVMRTNAKMRGQFPSALILGGTSFLYFVFSQIPAVPANVSTALLLTGLTMSLVVGRMARKKAE